MTMHALSSTYVRASPRQPIHDPSYALRIVLFALLPPPFPCGCFTIGAHALPAVASSLPSPPPTTNVPNWVSTLYRVPSLRRLQYVEEVYQGRKDCLLKRVRRPLQQSLEEFFAPGRVYGLRRYFERPGKQEVMDFYVDARIDGLVCGVACTCTIPSPRHRRWPPPRVEVYWMSKLCRRATRGSHGLLYVDDSAEAARDRSREKDH